LISVGVGLSERNLALLAQIRGWAVPLDALVEAGWTVAPTPDLGDGHARAHVGKQAQLVQELRSASLAPEAQDLNEAYHPHDVLH
jgi:hypothetical protein